MNYLLLDLAKYPGMFWVASAVLIFLILEAFARWSEAWVKPALVIYGNHRGLVSW